MTIQHDPGGLSATTAQLMQLSSNMAPGARLCRNCWASCLRRSRSFFRATTISTFVGGAFSSTFSVAFSPVTSFRAGLHGECQFSIRCPVMVHSTSQKKRQTSVSTKVSQHRSRSLSRSNRGAFIPKRIGSGLDALPRRSPASRQQPCLAKAH